MNIFNVKIARLYSTHPVEIEKVAQLNNQITKLQDEKFSLQSQIISSRKIAQISNPATLRILQKPRRTKIDQEKFSGGP